jgi:hypothetical protein
MIHGGQEYVPDRYVFGPELDLRTLAPEERAQADPPHGWLIYTLTPRRPSHGEA